MHERIAFSAAKKRNHKIRLANQFYLLHLGYKRDSSLHILADQRQKETERLLFLLRSFQQRTEKNATSSTMCNETIEFVLSVYEIDYWVLLITTSLNLFFVFLVSFYTSD